MGGRSPELVGRVDWGDLFARGLKLSGAGFIFSLPSLLLAIAGYGAMMSAPLLVGLLEGRRGPMPFDLEMLFVAGMLAGMGLFGLAMVIGLVTGLLLPVASAHVVATDDLAAAFRVGEWWLIFRANLGGFILTFVLAMGGGVVGNFVVQFRYLTLILRCLTPFVLSALVAYITVVSSALFANAYRDGVATLGESAGPLSRQ